MQRGRRFKIAVGLLFPLFLVSVLLIAWFTRASWTAILDSQVDAQQWISRFGVWAPLVYVGIQVFQVVIFVVPGDVVQIAGGYLFGVVPGVLYSLVGIAIGSAIDFFVARALGRPFVEGVFGSDRVAAFDRVTGSADARTGFFLLFVIPGVPKDILVYLAGVSTLRFPAFLLVTMTGRLPGILGSAIIGDSAARERWFLSAFVFGLAVVLFALGVIFRTRLQRWVNAVLERRAARNAGEDQR
ncbi:MAG: TVP38/TMEM64 family protein [Spirochaetota bacterium]